MMSSIDTVKDYIKSSSYGCCYNVWVKDIVAFERRDRDTHELVGYIKLESQYYYVRVVFMDDEFVNRKVVRIENDNALDDCRDLLPGVFKKFEKHTE